MIPRAAPTFVLFVVCVAFAAPELAAQSNDPKPVEKKANIRISIGKCSEKGKKKPFLDDAVCVKHLDDATLCMAADGMGGGWVGDKSKGLIATEFAFDVLTRELTKGSKGAKNEGDVRRLVRRAIVAANEEIITLEKKPEYKTMASQIVLAFWRPNEGMYVAGVGVSRVYLIRANAISQLTVDQTLAQELLEKKTISAEDAKDSKYRNVIWKYLGTKEVGDGPEVRHVPALSKDRFLLCTHGLHGVVSDNQILKCMREHDDPQKCADALCRLAFDSGTLLDVACVVIDVR